jgi:hypothetical protein
MTQLPLGVLLVAFLMLEIVIVVVPIYVLVSSDESERLKWSRSAALTVQEASNKVGPSLELIYISLLGLQGFVAASLKTIPDHRLPPEQRIQYTPLFSNFALTLLPSINNIDESGAGFVFELHPGGVLAELFPPNATKTNDVQDDFTHDPVSTWAYINAAGAPVTYARRLTKPGLNPESALRESVAIEGGIAVFSTTTNLSNWWGNVIARLQLDDFLEAIHFDEMMKKNGLNWGIATADGAEPLWVAGSPDSLLVDGQLTVPGYGNSLETTIFSSGSKIGLRLCVRAQHLHQQANSSNLTMIIVLGSLLSLSLLAIINCILFSTTRVYTGEEHAPKRAPFAMTIVAVDHGEDLGRTMSSEAWLASVNEFNGRVRQSVERHRGYLSQSLLQHCHVIVTRSIDAAIHLSYDLIEDLMARPIAYSAGSCHSSGSLRVLVTCHWCESISQVSPELNYEGSDVLYAVKFFRAAALPNRVVASWTAMEVSRGMRSVQVAESGTVELRDIVEEQEWSVVFDPNSKLLAKGLLTPVELEVSSGAPPMIQAAPMSASGIDNPLRNPSRSLHDESVSSVHSDPRGQALRTLSKRVVQMDASSRLTASAEAALKRCFAGPSELLGVDYEDVRFTLGTIFCALSILLDSFASKERQNILRRLAVANSLSFGPLLLEELSVRCLVQSKLVFFQQDGSIQVV